ncbi:hypothetical protein Rhe02_84340 [Rhizocola hellebori]|uniref:Uncharacterized protein n=1 Tax=Rhizocola hellebori TaxID=1392758 RepID=A0A8J3QHY4_9ACTN|nr:laminin G domain-containing protein [Rhizocola hellebori]GIH10367.1 hypothetical protein Rhe02_84340 [Rhizocola hellebori]
MSTPSGVPPLDSLSGGWVAREELAHLPSLRNQWGQAHANADLTSLSWLALPPYSGGYHTGALRIDGVVPAATAFRWAPWGVQRRAQAGPLHVVTDTRMGYEQTNVLWRTEVTNTSGQAVTVTVSQELLAPVAVSEVDWGWLYGTPWNDGHYHDFFATERTRAEVLATEPGRAHLFPPGRRWIRLGRPRNPGIQRDEDSSAMLLEAELPDHTSPDSGRVRPPAVLATIRFGEREFELDHPEREHRLDPIALAVGETLSFDFSPAAPDQSGVLLTHGNHPDSIQFGLTAGRPWLRLAGERLESPVVLAPGRWHRLAVTLGPEGATFTVNATPAGVTQPWWAGQRWHARVDGDRLAIADSSSPARSVYSFAIAPQSLTAQGSRGLASWTLALQPGQSTHLGITLHLSGAMAGHAPASHAAAGLAVAGGAAVGHATAGLAAASGAAVGLAGAAPAGGAAAGDVDADVLGGRDFDADFAEVADRWRLTWAAAFTPGNKEFSGHLPTLVTADAGLSRTYYLGALLAIYMRNTGVSPIGPVFLTGGPRLGPTTTFYWDQSEWARTAALLEPAGMRAWIVAALAQPYDRSHSFDTRNLLPTGNHYAANDHALFRTVQAYLGITADLRLLQETCAGVTVLDHLRAMAYRHREHRAAFGEGVLADFGADAWELLECVPNYRHGVVSFNAGYVGMLRSLARLLRLLGEPAEAAQAEAEAAQLAGAVLRQYAGGGRWRIAAPQGGETIGHCLDFALVAADMTADLSDVQREEMVDFVCGHLLDGDWMRALSPDDPVAPYSDRPDHGAAGAFGAWPGATAYGLARLGRPDLAQQMLSRAHAATSGGLWGQAMEAVGGGRYRVAERGVANRDTNAAIAVTEAVIAGLFGIHAGYADLTAPAGSPVSGAGELRNINAHGFSGYQRKAHKHVSPHGRHCAAVAALSS